MTINLMPQDIGETIVWKVFDCLYDSKSVTISMKKKIVGGEEQLALESHSELCVFVIRARNGTVLNVFKKR